VEALSPFGTARYMVFFVIQLKTRAVEVAGIHVDPDGEWMKQMVRNLVDPVEGFLRGAPHLIHGSGSVVHRSACFEGAGQASALRSGSEAAT
jgi:hypothetical protein